MGSIAAMKTFILLTAIAAAFPAVANETQPEYTAHEWGTFTSVQGANGVQLEWNPFVVWDLPDFVYSSFKPVDKDGKSPQTLRTYAAKSGYGMMRQRMETPVIYFYADQTLKVDVGVNFPTGLLTEWYPALAAPKPTDPAPTPGFYVPKRTLDWAGVEIVPGKDPQFPTDNTGNHYYAARQTDAAPLRVQTSDGVQNEKFLFYRGVGSFVAPLNVTSSGSDQFYIRVTQPKVTIAAAFIYSVRGDQAVIEPLPRIADTDKEATIATLKFAEKARPLAEVRKELSATLRTSLTAAGLFEKESAAMVQTWEESWFGEQGTRILYILPRSWCDEVLPLTFKPAPKKLERVFVGRAEIFTPAQEWTVMKAIMRYAEGTEADKARRFRAGDETFMRYAEGIEADKAAASALLEESQLGRFADAVVRKHIAANAHMPTFHTAGLSLLETLRPKKDAKVAAK